MLDLGDIVIIEAVCFSLLVAYYIIAAWHSQPPDKTEDMARARRAGATTQEAEAIVGHYWASQVPLLRRADVEHALNVRVWALAHRKVYWDSLQDIERAMELGI